jgi:MFS family permease
VANLFLAAGIALIGGSDVLPMYFLAMGVLTIGQMLGAMANATTISDLSTPRLRARYQAVFYLSMPLAGFVAPALGGWSLQRLGAWTWPIFGALGALAALGHLVAAPARQRRVAALRKAAESATLSLNSCA